MRNFAMQHILSLPQILRPLTAADTTDSHWMRLAGAVCDIKTDYYWFFSYENITNYTI